MDYLTKILKVSSESVKVHAWQLLPPFQVVAEFVNGKKQTEAVHMAQRRNNYFSHTV